MPRAQRYLLPPIPRLVAVWEADWGVVESGGLVSAWYPRHHTQHELAFTASGGARPTFSATALGTGRPGLTFDGSSDVMAAGESVRTESGTGITVVTAIRSSSAVDCPIITRSTGVAATNGWRLRANRGAVNTSAGFTVWEGGTNTERITAGADATTGTNKLVVGQWSAGRVARVIVDGAVGGTTATCAAGKRNTGSVLRLGADAGVPNYGALSIGFVGIWDRQLTDQELHQLRVDYIVPKWGTP